MTQHHNPETLAEAAAWHLRLQQGDAGQWEAFVLWLEGDPARSDAYDLVTLADAELTAEAFPALKVPAANDNADTGAGIWRWAAGLAAIAAALLVALFVIPWSVPAPQRYEVATAAGERRMVAIGDGSSAELNGGTKLILDRSDPRFAELAAGEATFTVRHDAAHPFTVLAGEHRVQDVGTRFNLVRDRGTLSLEVIEGSVLYQPGGAAIPVTAGRTLDVRDGARPVLGSRAPTAMAGWRQHRLSYTGTPLATVASDLSRSLGVQVTVDPGVAALRFTGSIRTDGDPAAAVADLAASIDLQPRHDGAGWRIGPRARATH